MRIDELIADRGLSGIQSIHPDATLSDAARKMMTCHIGALVVEDDQSKLVGIVSERDLIHLVADNNIKGASGPVSGVMSRSVITCTPDDEVAFVLRLMDKHTIRHLPVVDRGKPVTMVSIRELTRAYEVLQIEANTDPLTELSNRRQFLKTLREEVDRTARTNQPLTVAMIDIDHFKAVNDTYGHTTGDIALRALSDMMVFEFRSIDFIGRLGGEEFAVIFPDTDVEGAKIACERLRRIVQTTEIKAGRDVIKITVSIGIAAAYTRGTASVLKRADEMLYAAKAEGRNRIVADGLNSAA